MRFGFVRSFPSVTLTAALKSSPLHAADQFVIAYECSSGSQLWIGWRRRVISRATAMV